MGGGWAWLIDIRGGRASLKRAATLEMAVNVMKRADTNIIEDV